MRKSTHSSSSSSRFPPFQNEIASTFIRGQLGKIVSSFIKVFAPSSLFSVATCSSRTLARFPATQQCSSTLDAARARCLSHSTLHHRPNLSPLQIKTLLLNSQLNSCFPPPSPPMETYSIGWKNLHELVPPWILYLLFQASVLQEVWPHQAFPCGSKWYFTLQLRKLSFPCVAESVIDKTQFSVV